MLYLLNTPVLTNYGNYCFQGPISIEEANTMLSNGFESAIGHQATAEVLSQLLNFRIAAKRQTISLEPNDQALVFRLLQRIPEGKILSRSELMNLPFELGVITRLG